MVDTDTGSACMGHISVKKKKLAKYSVEVKS